MARETSNLLCLKLKELICDINWLKLQAPCVEESRKEKADSKLTITNRCADKEVCIFYPRLNRFLPS